MSLFCDTALAERIERVERQLISLGGQAARARTAQPGFVIPLAGGVATSCEDGSPFNTQPGSKSQHNVQRRGFDLLYTRAVLVKQPG